MKTDPTILNSSQHIVQQYFRYVTENMEKFELVMVCGLTTMQLAIYSHETS